MTLPPARRRDVGARRCRALPGDAQRRGAEDPERRAQLAPSGSRTSSRYTRLATEQFAYSLLTRSQRISHENLRLRDAVRGWKAYDGLARRRAKPVPPMLLPLTRARHDPRRTASWSRPWRSTSAVDGLADDFHLVHLGARAMGGAGLVIVRDDQPSRPRARITPGCTGLWNDAQAAALDRIVDFVHGQSSAAHRACSSATQRPQGLDPGACWEDDRRAAATTATGRCSPPSPMPYWPAQPDARTR
jgi:hypothetical protein